MLLAIGVASGLLEPAGWELAGAINAISYLAWAVWLIIVGIVILIRRAPQVNEAQVQKTFIAVSPSN